MRSVSSEGSGSLCGIVEAARDARGGVLVLVVLVLPVFLAALGLVVEGARLIHLRHQLSVAADLGALAGVQRIDLTRLAAGERFIPPGPAAADARQWTERNLAALVAPDLVRRAEVEVYVLNGYPEAPLVHPLTGRQITNPTVSTVITLEDVPLYLVPGLVPVRVQVHADATVETR